jgi:hypothetical protein
MTPTTKRWLPVALLCTAGALLIAPPALHPDRALAAGNPDLVVTSSPDSTARKQLTPIVQDTTGDAQALAKIRERIAGHEEEPAAKVFKNIKVFTEAPAGQVPRIMGAWTRVLGVGCTHCHVAGEWDKDDKPTKQIARDMAHMTGEINGTLLKNIPNLRSEEPHVSCTTCHRGQPKPATQLEQKP